MKEIKKTCDICGKIIPPYINESTFNIPYQTLEIHYHEGDKYHCDFCLDCADKISDYLETLKDILKKDDKNEVMCSSCKYGNNQTVLRCKYCEFATNWINFEPKEEE